MAQAVKNLPSNEGDAGDKSSIPESRRSPGGGNGNLLQYSCLEAMSWTDSLAGYSSWSHKASGATERVHTVNTYRLSIILP